jgi:hypothetical protein
MLTVNSAVGLGLGNAINVLRPRPFSRARHVHADPWSAALKDTASTIRTRGNTVTVRTVIQAVDVRPNVPRGIMDIVVLSHVSFVLSCSMDYHN